MSEIHWVIPDLFLPVAVAKPVCADLALPALTTLLARSRRQDLALTSLESWLCQAFEVSAIAPVTLRADGIEPAEYCWMRADPVHLRLDRDQMILQTNVALNLAEAQTLCCYLSDYFEDYGLQFIAPHPQRWYVKLAVAPDLSTQPVAQVEGRNARFYLPTGAAALQWHSIFNEAQMALFAHPINQAAAERGEVSVNSLWFWGEGVATPLTKFAQQFSGDSALAQAFAQVAAMPTLEFDTRTLLERNLLVTEALSVAVRRGDFYAWRAALLRLEQEIAGPLLVALRNGSLAKLTLDVLQVEASSRFEITRSGLWQFWKKAAPLSNYELL